MRDTCEVTGIAPESLVRIHERIRTLMPEFEFTYWTPAELEVKLKDAPRRLQEHTRRNGDGQEWVWKSHEVLVDNKWYTLGRTDLVDNVTTYGGIEIGPHPTDTCHIDLSYCYGARVTVDTIFVIDRLVRSLILGASSHKERRRLMGVHENVSQGRFPNRERT